MREIKFRAFKNNMMNYDPELTYNSNVDLNRQIKAFEEYDYELMQYTGLTDRSGIEIYEGDIVQVLYTDWTSQHLAKSHQQKMTLEEYLVDISHLDKVVWDEEDCKFALTKGSLQVGSHGRLIVIGNIYENPELLNEIN